MVRRAAAIAVLLAVALPATLARGASSLLLPRPDAWGEIPAEPFDAETRRRLGEAWLRFTRTPDAHVLLEGRSEIDGGASLEVRAELAPVADGAGLRLLRQHSRSRDAEGHPLGVMEIDHEAREGRCTPPRTRGEPATAEDDAAAGPPPEIVTLPEADRIVDVPLNLFFRPLALGERRELHFPILLCSGRPRVVPAVARVSEADDASATLIRIRYELALPKLLSAAFSRWLPSLSFWFDREDRGRWIGHEMPLYGNGPTVLILRKGMPERLLGR